MNEDLKQLDMRKGSNNHNWNGGVSEYPDHYKMKKNRLVKLQETKRHCEICNEKATKIHHKDYEKFNHELSNLIVVCNLCHGILHADRKNGSGIKKNKYFMSNKPRKSKFNTLYGITLPMMKKTYNKPMGFFYKLHYEGRLENYLGGIGKYERLYGLSKEAISEKYQIDIDLIPSLHRIGKLSRRIENYGR